jgi:protein gp37
VSDATKIQWTDSTWNPVRGCTKVSPGCKNCYAERFAERWRGIPGHPFEQGFDVRLVPEALDLPLRWKKPRRVFVNSMSDLFHPDVPDEFIARVFGTMTRAPQHVFQVLTKRADRMRDWVTRFPGLCFNVWLGVSVENQATADERIPELLATPAAIRFLSCEPLLGPVELPMPKIMVGFPRHITRDRRAIGAPLTLHWVIVGGESGPGARPCHTDWIRSVVEQCKAAGVPVFVKQLGAHATDLRADEGFRMYLRDRKGSDPDEWPSDLRVREFPEVQP